MNTLIILTFGYITGALITAFSTYPKLFKKDKKWIFAIGLLWPIWAMVVLMTIRK